jgi:hypothetical protein
LQSIPSVWGACPSVHKVFQNAGAKPICTSSLVRLRCASQRTFPHFCNVSLASSIKFSWQAIEHGRLRQGQEGGNPAWKKEIADKLDISVNTVSTHMQRVYEKLHVTTNTGAVAKALREKLI